MDDNNKYLVFETAPIQPITVSLCLLYKVLNMQLADLYQKALQFEFLTIEEGMFLFEHAPDPG